MPRSRANRYAEWLHASASRHGEDPFLLAALMVRMSQCLPEAKAAEGLGLTAIQPSMVRTNVTGRRLSYRVMEQGQWVDRVKTLEVGFFEPALAVPEVNLEWAAALLSMWREQHEAIDHLFEQQPHRHHVSHFVWGDRVPSARAEDRIFTDRRRLLAHYGPAPEAPARSFRGVAFGLPLEGGPRVVSSQPGVDRDGGVRLHRGVDVEAMFGEPVLAMADGRVAFAGVDYPGQASNAALSPAAIMAVPRKSLGRGGRFVCITHLDAHGDEAWLRSCYMHLEDVRVDNGQLVRRGDVIGTVGRTGMRRSAPHLHLELKSDKYLYDAREVLDGLLLGEPPPDPRKKRRPRRALTQLVSIRP